MTYITDKHLKEIPTATNYLTEYRKYRLGNPLSWSLTFNDPTKILCIYKFNIKLTRVSFKLEELVLLRKLYVSCFCKHRFLSNNFLYM